jgi:hypothetical protein
VQFEACPLKSAWLEAGLAEADVALSVRWHRKPIGALWRLRDFQSPSKLGSRAAKAAAASRFDADNARADAAVPHLDGDGLADGPIDRAIHQQTLPGDIA